MQKNNKTAPFKKKKKFPLQNKYNNFDDQVVDFFPNQSKKQNNQENDDYIFNKAPVLSKNLEKPAKKTKKFEKKQKSSIYRDLDEEIEAFEPKVGKKQKMDDIFQDQETFFSSFKQSFITFFSSNKSSLKSITKLNSIKYSSGNYVMGSVCEKGPNGKYLIVNLSRNKKAFISCNDISEESKNFNLDHYTIGEYVFGKIITSTHDKKCQISLKPSEINFDLSYEDILPGQNIIGIVHSEEDHGWTVNIHGQEEISCFINKAKDKISPSIYLGKPYLLKIISKEKKKKIVTCEFISNDEETSQKILTFASNELEESADFHQCVKPGNLFKIKVVKILENGILVRFFKFFYGFIFDEHLHLDLKEIKVNEKLMARVIYLDMENKRIHLSSKINIINLENFNRGKFNFVIGKVYEGFNVKKELGGHNYLVEIKINEKNSICTFLSKNQINEKEELTENENYNDKIKIKEFNYFEGYPMSTIKKEFMDKNMMSWNDIIVGEFYDATISKILQNNNKSYLLINLTEKIKGFIDVNNMSDNPNQFQLSKKTKVNGKIKVRVLNYDPNKKRINLTIKPIFMNIETPIILNMDDIVVGNNYFGYISGSNDYGYFVSFFNDLKGLLTYKDITDVNNLSKDSFTIGQTIKVYVTFINKENNKIGLSMSLKGYENQKKFENKKKFKNIDELINLQNENLENINLGDIFDYKVDKKLTENSDDYLILKTSKNHIEKQHKAIIFKDHLSDYKFNIEKLFDLYKNSKSLLIKCQIIEKKEHNIQVTAKKSLINQILYKTFPFSHSEITEKTRYYCYVSKIKKQGIIVKFHEKLTAFIPSKSIENGENLMDSEIFARNNTVKTFVKKVDLSEKKIYASLLPKDTCIYDNINDESPFLNYFNEESLIFKKSLNLNLKKWNKLKIGNFIQGKITHIKDYGLLIEILEEEGLTGLILTNNLMKEKKDYQKNYIIKCQILDIDFEKEIIDLREIDVSEEKFNKLKEKKFYLFEKLKKLQLLKKDNQKFIDLKVLIAKEAYIIAQLNNYKNILVLIESRKLNETQNTTYEIKQKISGVAVINQKLLKKSLTLTPNQMNEDNFWLNKSNYLLVCEISSSSDKIDEEDNSNQGELVIGGFVSGKITKIKKNNVYVQISKKIIGRIHKTQFDFDPETHSSLFDLCKVNEKIEAKILSLPKSKKSHNLELELTKLSSHMNLDPKSIDESILLPSLEELKENISLYKGRKYPGLIKSILKKSNNPFYIELSNSHFGFCSVFDGLVSLNDIDKLNNLSNHYKINQMYDFYVIDLEHKTEENKSYYSLKLSMLPFENPKSNEIEIEKLYICKITNILSKGLRVQISSKDFANVDILEVCDEWLADPLNRFEIGIFVKARILNKDNNKINVSLRDSITNEKTWKVLSKNGSTQEYKQMFDEIEKIGDLRNRIFKLGSVSLKTGMIVMGYVNQTNEKGCFIKIGLNTIARARISEISDHIIDDPSFIYYPNRLIIARITNILPDNKIDISLKESVVKYGFSLNVENLKIGHTIEGIIVNYVKDKALVSIKGCRFLGTLHPLDCDENDEESMNDITKLFKKGQEIKAKILKIDKEPKIKIKLGTKQKYFDNHKSDDNELMDTLRKNDEEKKIIGLYESVSDLVENFNKETNKASKIKITGNFENKEKNKEDEMEIENLKEISDSDSDDDIILDENDSDEEVIDKLSEDEESEKDSEDLEEENGDKIEIEEEKQEEKKIKKKSKKKKEKEFIEREIAIRLEEQKLMKNEINLNSNDDYEKLLLKDLNSSYTWIKYMAFNMEKEGIESARRIAERALQKIIFKNENDKLNVWTAYMNLESNFGTEKHLIKVFERALTSNNPKKVYFKLIDIYRRNSQYQLICELCKKMLKKHKNSSKAWLEYIKSLMEFKQKLVDKYSQNYDENHIKTVTKQALQSLAKKKHIEFLSHYGRLEFINGDLEKGRTTFEAILANYPKRVDLWSMYLDLETKYGSKESIRNLYERCISLSLKAKKMKFFFKRYLEYELSQGSEERIEYVKGKANEYVENILKVNENEESEHEN